MILKGIKISVISHAEKTWRLIVILNSQTYFSKKDDSVTRGLSINFNIKSYHFDNHEHDLPLIAFSSTNIWFLPLLCYHYEIYILGFASVVIPSWLYVCLCFSANQSKCFYHADPSIIKAYMLWFLSYASTWYLHCVVLLLS